MELESLMQESIKIMEDEFYKKEFSFSYSSLNKLLWSPAAFYQIYVQGIREEKTESHLVQGKIIHALLLEPDNFNKNFIISPDNLPTGNLKTLVDRVFNHHLELKQHGDVRENLDQFSDAILDVLKDMNYHQSLKTDQQRFDKVILPETISYWNYLKNKGNKTLIDQASYDFCHNAVELIKTDTSITKLLGIGVSDFENKEVYNELFIDLKIPSKAVGIKGIIDNIVIDHDKRIVFINDIKTTSKDLKDFKESVEFYSYWLQAAIYATLVALKYENLFEEHNYRLEFRFVVIDRMFQTYPFLVTDTTLQDWFDKFTEALTKAEWHYTNKQYTLPYDFAKQNVVL